MVGARDAEAWPFTMLDHVHDAVTSGDLEGRLVGWNVGAERLYGYAAGEVFGRTVAEVMRPEAGPEGVARDIDRLSRGERIEPFDAVHHAKDGRPLHVSVALSPIRDSGGEVTGVLSVSRDITARKEAELALERSEERFRSVVENSSEAVKILGYDGTLGYANPAFERLFGYAPEEVLGRNMHDFVHPEDLPRVIRAAEKAIAEPGVARNVAEYRFRHKDGFWVDVEATGTYLLGTPGVDGVLVNARDVTARKRIERRLQEARTRYRVLVEQTPAVTYSQNVDHGHAATYVSPQIEAMTGYAPEEYYADSGLWHAVVHPDDRGRVLTEDGGTDRTGGSYSSEYRLLHKDGREVWVRNEATLVLGEDEKPRYWLGVLVDVTARTKAEEALERTERRYRSLVENVPTVVYVDGVDESNLANYRSPYVSKILGYSPEEFYVPGFWQGLLHPEDRERVLAENERTNRTGEPFRIEYRMIHRDGSAVWLRDEAVLVRDGEGRPTHWQGFFSDITDRKEVEGRLRESEERLRAVTDGAPVILFALDRDGTLIFEGGAALEDLGIEAGTNVGSSIFEDYADLQDVVESVRKALAGEQVTATVEIGGRSYHVVYSPQRDGRGEISGVIGVATDVTERRRLEDELRRRATHDPLTGVPNRTLLAERIERALARARREEREISVLFLDLDDLKTFNDRLGHEVGDRILVAVAEGIRSVLGPDDVVARLGGDEFVVLLEDAGRDGAGEVADRIAAVLQGLLLPVEDEDEAGGSLSVGASIGVAVGGTDARGPEDLIRAADHAMYRAKEHGKDGRAVS
jgi:diguanylate cyclase (GGDEF)-like protein/PAS domain S-box-containing protein